MKNTSKRLLALLLTLTMSLSLLCTQVWAADVSDDAAPSDLAALSEPAAAPEESEPAEKPPTTEPESGPEENPEAAPEESPEEESEPPQTGEGEQSQCAASPCPSDADRCESLTAESASTDDYTEYDNNTSFSINGITIKASDVSNQSNNRTYANAVYNLIWATSYSSDFEGSLKDGWNLLRGLSDSQRRLSAGRLRRFIGSAEPGAVIRITSCTSECERWDSDEMRCGHRGHSLILVSRDSNGLTVLDNHLTDGTAYSVTTRHYTWEGFVRYWGAYHYVKYIKWPNAPEYSSEAGEESEAESVCYENCTYKALKAIDLKDRPDSEGSSAGTVPEGGTFTSTEVLRGSDHRMWLKTTTAEGTTAYAYGDYQWNGSSWQQDEQQNIQFLQDNASISWDNDNISGQRLPLGQGYSLGGVINSDVTMSSIQGRFHDTGGEEGTPTDVGEPTAVVIVNGTRYAMGASEIDETMAVGSLPESENLQVVLTIRYTCDRGQIAETSIEKSFSVKRRVQSGGRTVAVNEEYEVITLYGLNMRESASTSGVYVTTLWPGTTIRVVWKKNAEGYTWGYGTSSNGYSGWTVINNSWTRLISSPESEPDPEPESPNPTYDSLSDKEKKDADAVASALNVDSETAAQMKKAADKLGVSLNTVKLGGKTILNTKNDKDFQGSDFGKLTARSTKRNETAVTLGWKKQKNADGYLVYGATSGKQYKLLNTIKKNGTVTYTQKKCNKGTYYKYMVVAYKNVNGQKMPIAASAVIHVPTKGGKYTAAKSVKLTQGKKAVAKLTIKKGKSVTIKASEVKDEKKLKMKTHRVVKFESSAPKIATVNKSGKITGKKKGSCTVWAYAQNGIFKAIKVTVK